MKCFCVVLEETEVLIKDLTALPRVSAVSEANILTTVLVMSYLKSVGENGRNGSSTMTMSLMPCSHFSLCKLVKAGQRKQF